MNKKIKIGLFVFIFIGVIILNITYKNKEVKTKRKKQNGLAIMIKEDGATDYTKSNSKDIPKGNYALNYEKSYCKNNGVIGDYDSTLGKVSFSFIGTDSCYLYFDYYLPGYITILNNNGGKDAIETKGTPDFSVVATENEGMYAAQDDLGTSYYFRGAVDNNWIKFGKDSNNNDMYWRIIRINGDGSIRMIYSGTIAPDSSTATVMTGTETQISTNSFNDNKDESQYVGYMYTAREQHGNILSSRIKTTLDNWHKTTLETDNATKQMMAEQIFCNDRSVITGTWSFIEELYYAAGTRLKTNKSPVLTCPTESDKFTLKTSGIGNKTLDYPVGLITADEIAMAGGVWYTNNTSYYLYTNQYYWTGSPCDYSWDYESATEVGVYSSGELNALNVAGTYGVRPVISLSSSIKLTGNGTWNNVYEVVN